MIIQSPPTLKLRFTLARKEEKYEYNFYVKIDNVIEPAHPMLLIKYSEAEDNKVTARATNKIKYKMALSVDKEVKIRE